ncbi:MAG: alpha-amylase [Lachnospiraceae bacterium]|nr:alpha-amylase [Lachnospiraceae bacterium]
MKKKKTADGPRMVIGENAAMYDWFPGVRTRGEYTDFTIVAGQREKAELVLYYMEEEEPAAVFAFPEEGMGNVRSLTLSGVDRSRMEYCLRLNSVEQADPCSRVLRGRPAFGKGKPKRLQTLYQGPKEAREKAAQDAKTESGAEERRREEPLRSGFLTESYDWGEERRPQRPWSETILYQLHVRGFTIDSSSGVASPGTFGGLTEKIPYLLTLGITAVELQPVFDFDENGEAGPVNYWGYTGGYFFAPKSEYCDRACAIPADVQFKDMVKAFHEAGLEVLLQFCFVPEMTPDRVIQVLRFWAVEYHVDGFRVMGDFPGRAVLQDPVLAGRKLLAGGWGMEESAAMPAIVDGGFQESMRRLVRGDEDQLKALVYHIRSNPAKWPPVHCIAEYAGFTLKDLVSYETKHNEANGENNRDGSWYNYSDNCGAEGPVKDETVRRLRLKQRMNALLLVFLSQGVPLLQAGDEWGHTRGGNNNAWCQDNGTNWLNWEIPEEEDRELCDFIRTLIAFRTRHDVFHQATEPQCCDYLSVGMPDLSIHGVHPWLVQYENFRRQLGVLYNGAYGKTQPQSSFYVLFNFHNTAHLFDLPKAPGGGRWHVKLDTGAATEGRPVWAEAEKEEPVAEKTLSVSPRSVMILTEKKPKEIGKKKSGRGRRV